MNVSSVNIGLTGKDLLGIYNDFISINELNIENIEIKDDIKIIGSFTKGVTISFECIFKLSSMENGLIKGEVIGFKVLNIGIASFFRKIALKFALKELKDKGISYIDGKVIIQYKYLLKDIPYIDFDIFSIYCAYGLLNVELKNVNVSLGGGLRKDIKLLSFAKEESEEFNKEEIIKKEDCYTRGRERLENKLNKKLKPYSDYIFILPDIVALIYRLLKDKRVNIKTKMIISVAVAYITVPSDLIPDKIPFVGKVDDIAIGIFSLNFIMSNVPLNIVLENWQGKNDLLIVIKNLIDYASNFTGAKNVDSLYRVMEEMLSV